MEEMIKIERKKELEVAEVVLTTKKGFIERPKYLFHYQQSAFDSDIEPTHTMGTRPA